MDTIRSETVLIKRSRRVELGPTQMTPVFELSHGRKRARLVTTTCGREREWKRRTRGTSMGKGGRVTSCDERKGQFSRAQQRVSRRLDSLGGEGAVFTRERVI